MEEETKTCENCKREIPAVNFTIHTVHCARNIRVCPVCKEPIPQADLEEHHEKLHKLLPCKECGESVCGTDLEDHIRDSCAHTMKTCRYCELELRRGSMPAHERYCGARTEQCTECKEWVMHKYKQLHLDSNHGFIRLDDDPVPDAKPSNVPKLLNLPKSSSDPIRTKPDLINGTKKPENLRIHPSTSTSNKNISISTQVPSSSGTNINKPVSNINQALNVKVNDVAGSSTQNGAVPRTKRTNDQPQVNAAVAAVDKVQKELWASRGAVKKRPAPKPPTKPAADPKRDLPLNSALQRQENEERQREEQTAYNLSVGLPPVLSPAAKLEKLRKMDLLQNPGVEDQDYKNRLQGRVWMNRDVPIGHMLGSSSTGNSSLETARRKSKSKTSDVRPNDLKNLKPMTPQEFVDRFNEIQLQKETAVPVKNDRFSQIKSSLRELRRGLNEVTAPYNSIVNNDSQNMQSNHSPEESDVSLPCEFCNTLVPLEDLVQHQTGCRPDLTQLKPRKKSENASRNYPSRDIASRNRSPRDSAPTNHSPLDPVVFIPCEFCTEPQPVYLLNEHQERCGRDANMLFPD